MLIMVVVLKMVVLLFNNIVDGFCCDKYGDNDRIISGVVGMLIMVVVLKMVVLLFNNIVDGFCCDKYGDNDSSIGGVVVMSCIGDITKTLFLESH